MVRFTSILPIQVVLHPQLVEHQEYSLDDGRTDYEFLNHYFFGGRGALGFLLFCLSSISSSSPILHLLRLAWNPFYGSDPPSPSHTLSSPPDASLASPHTGRERVRASVTQERQRGDVNVRVGARKAQVERMFCKMCDKHHLLEV